MTNLTDKLAEAIRAHMTASGALAGAFDAQPSEWAREFVARLVHAGRLIERYENPVMKPLSPENFRIYDSARRTECQSPKELTATVERLLAERDAEIARLRKACSAENDEICQTLGKALGCPWFKDHQDVFPGATEADGVCVGDHVAASLAAEAAKAVESLRAQLAGRVAVPEGWKISVCSEDKDYPVKIEDPSGNEQWPHRGDLCADLALALLAAAPEPAQTAPSVPEILPEDLPDSIIDSLRMLQAPKAIRELWAALRPLLIDAHRAQRRGGESEHLSVPRKGERNRFRQGEICCGIPRRAKTVPVA